MKHIFTLVILAVFAIPSFSQTNVEVLTGANYINDVYYSFDGGELATRPRNNWDIAFDSRQMSVTIHANNGAGIDLYTYSNGAAGDWASVDTTGMSWSPLYNSITNWENGAFNANTVPGAQFDYGWGVYNMTNHFINGDSIYILKYPDNTFKKLVIDYKKAVQNQYFFRFADLDGSNEVADTLVAGNYSTGFIHYSLKTGEVVEYEPESRWQLLFTRYFDYNIPYYVTGVLANEGIQVQEVRGVNQQEFENFDPELFNDTISQIGSDWKSFNMQTIGYEVIDDVVFFVQDTLSEAEPNAVWKVYFTGFGGSADGKYSFVQEKLTGPGTSAFAAVARNFTVYPNPAVNKINVVHDIPGISDILVYSLSGQLVQQITGNDAKGLKKQQVDITNLAPGMYQVIIRSDKEQVTTKFVKK